MGTRAVRLLPHQKEQKGEAIIPLINVVFLLLIFLMLVGNPRAPDPFYIDPAQTESERDPTDAQMVIFISSDFQVAFEAVRGKSNVLEAVERAFANDRDEPLEVKADASVDAVQLLHFVQDLKSRGVARIRLVTRAIR